MTWRRRGSPSPIVIIRAVPDFCGSTAVIRSAGIRCSLHCRSRDGRPTLAESTRVRRRSLPALAWAMSSFPCAVPGACQRRPAANQRWFFIGFFLEVDCLLMAPRSMMTPAISGPQRAASVASHEFLSGNAFRVVERECCGFLSRKMTMCPGISRPDSSQEAMHEFKIFFDGYGLCAPNSHPSTIFHNRWAGYSPAGCPRGSGCRLSRRRR